MSDPILEAMTKLEESIGSLRAWSWSDDDIRDAVEGILGPQQ